MANNSGQNNPSPESETNAQKEKLKKSGILPTPVVLVWLLGLVGAGLVTYGSGLLNAQFFWPGWTIICFGAVCGCVAARIWIINHKTKHRMPAWLDSNKTFGVAIFICAVVCGVAAFFSSRSSQNPKSAETSGPQKMLPNLTLALALSGSVSEPAKRVLLTNDFIVFNNVPEGGRIDVTNAVGALIIPIDASQSRVGLSFVVINNFPTEADNAQAIVVSADSMNCEGGPGWLASYPPEKHLKEFGWELPRPLKLLDSQNLPTLIFDNVTNGSMGIFGLQVRATGFGNSACRFHLMFCAMPNIEPHVGRGEFKEKAVLPGGGTNVLFFISTQQIEGKP